MRPSGPQLRAADHDSLRVRDLEVAFPPFGIRGRGGPQAFLDQLAVERVDAANAEDHAIHELPPLLAAWRRLMTLCPARIVVKEAPGPP